MKGIRTITKGMDEWPKELGDPGLEPQPAQLFVFGRELPAQETAVGIVGTRRPTAAGIAAAEDFARGLVQAGFAIISGLAVGIDAAAHRAALRAGGHTVAVLGCGLDLDYPRQNRRLRAEIESHGTVVSEYPEGSLPHKANFPLRNRLIAGLSKGILVVEGGFKSGALITAHRAIDANRYIWAVPGGVRNVMSQGPNELIRNSEARLVTEIKHVTDELAPGTIWVDRTSPTSQGSGLVDDELKVVSLLDDNPLFPERIRALSGLDPGRLAMALSKLEVRGCIGRIGGGYRITSAGARLRERAVESLEDS